MFPERLESVAPTARVVGLNRSYSREDRSGMPQQWAQWDAAAIRGGLPGCVYGISHAFSDGNRFEYMCAMAVKPGQRAPKGQKGLNLPKRDYAVFAHLGHVSGVAGIFDAVLDGPGQGPGWKLAKGPQIEVYGQDFDPYAMTGRIEVWFPIDLTA